VTASTSTRIAAFVLGIAAMGCGDDSSTSADAAVDALGDSDASNPDAPPIDAMHPSGSWELTGSPNGIDLDAETRSAIVRTTGDGRTLITLSNLSDLCAKQLASPGCPGAGAAHWTLEIALVDTAPGDYPVDSPGDLHPPIGKSSVALTRRTATCAAEFAPYVATAGVTQVTSIPTNGAADLTVAWTMTGGTTVMGSISAPRCD
jgi:hypothetical protein